MNDQTSHPQFKTQCKEILMCSPSSFDVTYVINPWMKDSVHNINKIKAESQWQYLHDTLLSYIQVRVVDHKEGLIDMVFIANAALVINNKCVLANFTHQERQAEMPYWQHWFITHGYEILELPSDVYFEGEGDALYDDHRKCIWAGYNFRSSKRAHGYLVDFFEKEVVSLELTDSYFYHLDTCFCVLPNGFVMYMPEAFSPESRARIHAHVPAEKQITVTREEALNFTCNAMPIYDTILCNYANDRITHILNDLGMKVHHTPVTEYMKSGGGAKCVILSLNRDIT